MTDDDKALVERLRSRAKWLEPELDVMDENEVLAAANRIEAQAAEIERLNAVVDALLQHDASTFWGPDGEKNKRASYRGVIRKAKKARAALGEAK